MNTPAPPPDALMDRLSRRERALVQKQGVRAVEQLRNEWNGQRRWLYGLSGVMALLSIALPTGLVHQYLTTAGVLSSLDILGAVAAGTAFAALHGAGAVYFWTHWNQRARTLDLLHTWLHPAPAPVPPEQA